MKVTTSIGSAGGQIIAYRETEHETWEVAEVLMGIVRHAISHAPVSIAVYRLFAAILP